MKSLRRRSRPRYISIRIDTLPKPITASDCSRIAPRYASVKGQSPASVPASMNFATAQLWKSGSAASTSAVRRFSTMSSPKAPRRGRR